MKIKQFIYLSIWFFKVRVLREKIPLQTVLFITDRCNLQCKHCSVYNNISPTSMTKDEVRQQLQYSYDLGSRFVDFEGGEPTMWRDGDETVNDLIDMAKEMGFFSCTITTNAQASFKGSHADSIWVSVDGFESYHDDIRGKGTFDRLKRNIASSEHKALSANMVLNTRNYTSLPDVMEFVKHNSTIKSIAINFHTPYAGTEFLQLDKAKRIELIDQVIAYKKKHYPIMNSVSGLKLMKTNKFKKYCWVSNFILVDGTRLTECAGKTAGVCDDCGFCMAGEMNSVFNFKPDTLISALRLRMQS